jgi:glycerol-3-phosphate acyltransferase PlsY
MVYEPVRDPVLVAMAYVLGSVPFGVFAARGMGRVDPRRIGSGNIGAANVLRAAGKGAAVLTLLGDLGKGAAAAALGRWFGVSPTILAGIGLAAVAGHAFPVFLGFRGGKGVATALGVILVVMPAVGGLLLFVWLLVAGIWRYSSLASLTACGTLPLLAWMLDDRSEMLALGGILAALIFALHRENIGRLWHGTERRIGFNSQVVK